MEIYKDLKVDTKKIEHNLEKLKKNEELIILIESGSFAPPHKMHIGLMEITKKYIEENYKTKKVIGGYLIPSSDSYVRHKLNKDFIPLVHRVNMSKIFTKNSDWLDVLDWGLAQGVKIQIYLQKIINNKFPKYDIKCVLVFGIDYYLKYNIHLYDTQICIFRPGYNINEVKNRYPQKLIFVEGKDDNISSTLIRKAIRENDEITIIELTSKEVLDYIKNNNIFEK